MKIFAYGCRPYDELSCFEKYSSFFGLDIKCTKLSVSEDNIYLAEGSEYVSVLTNPITDTMLDSFKSIGVKMIGTRTVGFDHIDCKYAKSIGIKISNSSYSPDAVAEFTLMLSLMSLRNMKRIIQRSSINDFTLKGLRGCNLSERKIGVIGTGTIGKRFIELLKGFGCEIYAYDPSPEEIEGVIYLPLKDLFSTCDMFSLHAPLQSATRHIINRNSLDLMPDGSVIINTARGGLIDSSALIEALNEGKIAACGLDVIEDEFDLYYYNRKADVINNKPLSILRDMPNVIISPHIAFYTSKSVDDMVRNCIQAFINDEAGVENPFRIV